MNAVLVLSYNAKLQTLGVSVMTLYPPILGPPGWNSQKDARAKRLILELKFPIFYKTVKRCYNARCCINKCVLTLVFYFLTSLDALVWNNLDIIMLLLLSKLENCVFDKLVNPGFLVVTSHSYTRQDVKKISSGKTFGDCLKIRV